MTFALFHHAKKDISIERCVMNRPAVETISWTVNRLEVVSCRSAQSHRSDDSDTLKSMNHMLGNKKWFDLFYF